MSLEHENRTIAPDGRPDSEQPSWRTDFPIDVPQDNYVARRDFTKFLGLTSLGFAVGQFWIAVQNWLRHRRGEDPAVKIAKFDQIPVGGVVPFTYPDASEPCLLICTSPGKLVAYNQKCTHLSCAVLPKIDDGRLLCPCHNGIFDLETGRAISGPPRRPLTRITLKIVDNEVIAIGEERRTV